MIIFPILFPIFKIFLSSALVQASTLSLTKMPIEQIVVHILILIVFLITVILLVQAWRYLNNKALGMTTILDQSAKDGMILIGLAMITGWTSWMKFGTNRYNYYSAMSMVKISEFALSSLRGQITMFFIIRYSAPNLNSPRVSEYLK